MCARLASVEKAGFFACPTNVVEDLVRCHVRLMPWAAAPTYILDPCAGEGRALHAFGQALAGVRCAVPSASYERDLRAAQGQIHLRAVEIDAARAAAARSLLGEQNVLHAAIENVSVVGKFQWLWLNPPYDQVAAGRAELAWVRMCAPFLGEAGSMALIVPDMFVGSGRYAREMAHVLYEAGFESSLVLRFPDPEYAPFKQVAVLARKPVSASGYRTIDLHVAGVIGGAPAAGYDREHTHIVRALPATPTLVRSSRRAPRPSVFGQAAPDLLLGLLGDPRAGNAALRPLAPMRSEHAAMVAAAGLFNGAVVAGHAIHSGPTGPSGCFAIKGSTVKRVVTSTTHSVTGNGTQVEEVVEAEVLAAQLATIDLATGAMSLVNSMDHKDAFEDLLQQHAGEFVDLAKRLYPPRFTPDDLARYGLALGRVHAPRALAGSASQNGLFPPQAFRAGAILDGWRRNKVVTLVGEPGVGKTVTAMAACAVKALRRHSHNQKVVVLLPPKEDLVRKWGEEIGAALKEFHPHIVHARTVGDVRDAFARDGLVFVLLKETTAKMSSGWAAVPPTRLRHLGRALCPACGQPLRYDVEDPDRFKAHCQHCQTPLWTATRRVNGNGAAASANGAGPRGYARYPLARYIRDRYRDRYLLIIDEAHNVKAADSARSYAAQDLLTSARCAIQMTGTLYNGLASSIYYLLWRALPEFRAVWGWSDVQRFINQYGLFEKITRTYRSRSGTSASGYENFTERKSERPGIHPAMIALLLPSTVFFGLRDLDVILPPYAEHTLFVQRPAELARVEGYLDAVKSDAVSRMMDGDHSLMAQWSWARLGAWDVASLGDQVDGHTLQPISCPGVMWPKEEALLRLVAREKRAGRKVLCFVGQINRRDVTPRLCGLLARYGMRGAVLRADEKQRVQFIRRALQEGADVVFTSAPLVKEGIDLLELPTLIWYAAEYDIYLVQQANRRSWRIGQTEPVHIYYLAYDRTPQAWAMQRIARKLAAAQTLQGDVRQGLAALLGEEDFVSRLQQATVESEHYESDLSLDDLPPLAPFAPLVRPDEALWSEASAQSPEGDRPERTGGRSEGDVDLHVPVRALQPARVPIRQPLPVLSGYAQLSLF